MELPGHAQVLWACLVKRGALGQTGESPTSYQAAPCNPLSAQLSPCYHVLSPRPQAGLLLEEEAADPGLGHSPPSTELTPGTGCHACQRMGAGGAGGGGLWHLAVCPTQSELQWGQFPSANASAAPAQRQALFWDLKTVNGFVF